MNRAGRISRDEVLAVADVLADAPFDGSKIQLLAGDEEEEASPPASTSEPDASSPSDSLENETSSGDPLKNGSEKSDEILEVIGTTQSDTFSPSAVPIRSVS